MTAIIRTKQGRPNYYVVINFKDADGKRREKWILTEIPVKGNNKRSIEERRREIEIEYESHDTETATDIDLRGDILFTDYLTQWLETQRTALADSTYQLYEYQVNKCIVPYFLPKKIMLKDLTPSHLDKYMKEKMKSVSNNTIRKYLTNISKCLDSAASLPNRIIPYNPAKVIQWPKKEEFMGAMVYDEAQIIKLLEVSKGDPMELMILITVTFGLRRSELLGLKWDAINFEQSTITIKHTVTRITKGVNQKDTTKTKSSYRVLPLSDEIKEQLESVKHRQDEMKKFQPNDYKSEGYIFTKCDGALISTDYPSRHFKLLITKHGLPVIRFHDLRHSAGTYLMYLGFSVKEIQEWLGHADINTTLKYLHFDMSGKRKMLDKINRGLKRTVNE